MLRATLDERMKFRLLKLGIFMLILSTACAKRFSGGSSSHHSRPSSSSHYGSHSSHTSGQTSSQHFLHAESGRPSHSSFSSSPSHSTHVQSPPPRAPYPTGSHSSAPYPTGSHSSAPYPTGSHSSAPYPTGSHSSAPYPTGSHSSAPYPTGSHSSAPYPTGTHSAAPYPTGSHSAPVSTSHVGSSSYGKPASDPFQRTTAHTSQSEYGRQPSSNPYIPSGSANGGQFQSHGGLPSAPPGISVPTFSNTHGSQAPNPPYPLRPNHPTPGSSIDPGFRPPPPLPTSSHTVNQQTSYPQLSSHNYVPNQSVSGSHAPYPNQYPSHSYPPNQYPQPGAHNYPSYYPSHGGPAQYPPGGHYPSIPQSQPFVPGRTVVIEKPSSGIGTAIAGGIAGGVAAGVTNAVVDHAISSIFRPGHVHVYPSAPPIGTPTSTVSHTTNNYYYGQPGGSNDNGNFGTNQGGFGAPLNQPVGQPTQSGTGPQNQNNFPQTNPGSQANPGVASAGPGASMNPSSNGAVNRVSEGQSGNPAPLDPAFISDEDIMKFTEELFDKVDSDLNQRVDLNLQKRVSGNNPEGRVPDEAPERLFNLKPDVDLVPTVRTLRALYDNYQRNGTKKEIMTPERRNEESAFLDEIIKTPVMTRALGWLVDRKYIESDSGEQKDLLKRMWFSTFDDTSSGFERVFLSEIFGDSGIVGMQNWLYFAHLESQNNVNYLGYVDNLSLSGKGTLLKLNYQSDVFNIQNATIFVGTPPELEMALYTVCFHARPNNWCPVSIGGAKFFILTHSFRYFGKDLIDLAFPAF